MLYWEVPCKVQHYAPRPRAEPGIHREASPGSFELSGARKRVCSENGSALPTNTCQAYPPGWQPPDFGGPSGESVFDLLRKSLFEYYMGPTLCL
jgi:hypothetical protein